MPLYNINAVVRVEAEDKAAALLDVAEAIETLADGRKKTEAKFDFLDINIINSEDAHDNARLS